MIEHKILTLEQIQYNERTDCARTLDEGFNCMASAGWELVTSFPSNGYATGVTTMFVFRRKEA